MPEGTRIRHIQPSCRDMVRPKAWQAWQPLFHRLRRVQAVRAAAAGVVEWAQRMVAPLDVFGSWGLDLIFFAAIGLRLYALLVTAPRQ